MNRPLRRNEALIVPKRTLVVKRTFDIVAALALLGVSILPVSMVAVVVRIDAGSPILFRQERLGKARKRFNMLKFRTMVQGAQNVGTGLFSFEDDPRVTRSGKVLREISIDEAPQLWNVLRGDMSLVGPRPPVVGELGPESDFDARTNRRFAVRPGITGLAQVSGRNELSWDKKIEMDNRYLDLLATRGFRVDLEILTKSVVIVLSRQGIIEQET